MVMPNFADPWFLFVALAAPLLLWWYWRRTCRGFPSVAFPAVKAFQATPGGSLKHRMRHLLVILKTVALLLRSGGSGEAQLVSQGQDVHSEGIDIVVALDISASMLARGFSPRPGRRRQTGRR